MKFVSSRDFRIKPGDIWAMLEHGEDMVITSHGRPMGILIGTNEGNMQQLLNELVRLRAKLAVTNMRLHAQSSGLDKLSDQKVNQLIDKVRKDNRNR